MRRDWVPRAGKALRFVCFFAVFLLAAPELLHWITTGELASISRGGGASRILSWQDEPGYLIFTALVRLGEAAAGLWGMIDTVRGGPLSRAVE